MAQPGQTEKAEKSTKLASAAKRQLQSEKRRLQNKAVRSHIRTAIRSFHQALSQESNELCFAALKNIHSLVDKAVVKGVFKLNKASRVQARLTAHRHAKKPIQK